MDRLSRDVIKGVQSLTPEAKEFQSYAVESREVGGAEGLENRTTGAPYLGGASSCCVGMMNEIESHEKPPYYG